MMMQPGIQYIGVFLPIIIWALDMTTKGDGGIIFVIVVLIMFITYP